MESSLAMTHDSTTQIPRGFYYNHLWL